MHFVDDGSVVELTIVNGVAMSGLADIFITLGELPQRFRGQRAIENTGTTDFIFFDQCDFFAEVQPAHGRCETGRATADDTQVKFFHGYRSPLMSVAISGTVHSDFCRHDDDAHSFSNDIGLALTLND